MVGISHEKSMSNSKYSYALSTLNQKTQSKVAGSPGFPIRMWKRVDPNELPSSYKIGGAYIETSKANILETISSLWEIEKDTDEQVAEFQGKGKSKENECYKSDGQIKTD